jgi:ubiquinone/menaquinone biosynthesis C-methylase UbiE
MQYTTQVDVEKLALWSFIIYQFPDVYYIHTPFWPVYTREEAVVLVQKAHQDHYPLLMEIDPEDQARLMQMAEFLKDGARGDDDPPEALAEEYMRLTRETYDAHAEDYHKTIVQHTPLDDKLVEFAGLISPGGTIIDIGCGPGQDIEKFLNQGKCMLGLDVSDAMVHLAHEITGVPIYHMDMRSLTLPDHFVEGIWCNATLLHLPRRNVPRALRDFHRILQPSGYLYVSVKQGSGASLVRREKINGSLRLFTYFSREELAHYLEQACFDIVFMIRFVTYRENIGWDSWINVLARRRNV